MGRMSFSVYRLALCGLVVRGTGRHGSGDPVQAPQLVIAQSFEITVRRVGEPGGNAGSVPVSELNGLDGNRAQRPTHCATTRNLGDPGRTVDLDLAT